MLSVYHFVMAIEEWTLEARWRTWLAHAAFAVLLSAVFGSWAAIVFYFLRELEQVWQSYAVWAEADWLDHWADVAAPFLAAGLTNVVWGW